MKHQRLASSSLIIFTILILEDEINFLTSLATVLGELSGIAAEVNAASKFQQYIALGALSGHDIMDNPSIWWKVYPPNYFALLDAHSLLFKLMDMSFQPSLASLVTILPSWVQLFNFLLSNYFQNHVISAWTSIHR
jgi:hypothetical protein